jgi:hypothetical protein
MIVVILGAVLLARRRWFWRLLLKIIGTDFESREQAENQPTVYGDHEKPSPIR